MGVCSGSNVGRPRSWKRSPDFDPLLVPPGRTLGQDGTAVHPFSNKQRHKTLFIFMSQFNIAVFWNILISEVSIPENPYSRKFLAPLN
jgi:hypothetical protein